ncbi:SDR family NAD(P)-dependent oxidoreductase [Streptomyces sp. NBC_00076]|uniref:SDR family NAD(P)-dependent oxidoreductase n=1 Tax=Streptomyces sp. NBC_00076 TaxID=2975642 RepID=UPI00386C0595
MAVAVADRHHHAARAVASAVTGADGATIPVVVDVADPAAPEAGVYETVDRLGGLDILVNNAGFTVRVLGIARNRFGGVGDSPGCRGISR